MKKITQILVVSVLWSGLMITSGWAQGSLTPMGAPGASMKTLDQIEPRTPISSAGYIINDSGSYYLTTNLTATTGQHGIQVSASHVTIDLNGFTIIGPGSSSESGIYQSSSYNALTILNGKVTDFLGNGRAGIYVLGKGCRVQGVQATLSYYGIKTGESSIVADCQAYTNLNSGIAGSYTVLVRDCVVRNNGGVGIRSSHDSVIIGCLVRDNKGRGISVGNGSKVTDCSLRGNGENGISTGIGAMINSCSIYESGENGIYTGSSSSISDCTVNNNATNGISVSSDSRVVGNQCDENGVGDGDGAGIHVRGAGNRIEGNNVTDNDRGLDVDDNNNYLADNTVYDNTDNYDLVAGNQVNILLCEVPETIDWPAKVKFAGSLTCSSTIANGITVVADDVTIDLDGHALVGPGALSWNGIYNDEQHNLTVCNGTIRNWRGSNRAGIQSGGEEGSFSNLCLTTNEYGIRVGYGTLVSDCLASYNNIGIRGIYETVIRGCIARYNNEYGIGVGGSGCQVYNNLSVHNGTRGIFSDYGYDSRIENNTVSDNRVGFEIKGVRNFVVGNTAARNSTNWIVNAGNICLVVQASTNATSFTGNSGGTAPGSIDPNANFSH